jgi:hypothetical protein
MEHRLRHPPDVDDLATVAEKASVGLPSENARLIDPDMESDPDEVGLRARTLLADYVARAQREAGKMTSERQKAANRANARHSTGPKTPDGKAAVRLNACWHGLLARDVVLPEEDADAFEDLFNRVRANLLPEGPIEQFLADSVVNTMWRLRRLARAETALLHSRIHGLRADRLKTQVGSYERYEQTYPVFPLQTVITDKAAHTEAREALERARYERDRDEVLLGRAIDADAKEGDAFAKLARYERSLERSFHRALDELRRIQDKRQNRPSSPILDAITLDTEGTECGTLRKT